MLRLKLFTLLLLPIISIHAQNPGDQIDPEAFNAELVTSLLMDKMNEFRMESHLDTFINIDILNKASESQAKYMAEIQRATDERDKGSMKTTADRVAKFGGTPSGDELTAYESAGRGRDFYTYKEVATSLLDKLTRSRRSEAKLKDPSFLYAGYGIEFDPDRKRIYLSMTMGGIGILNTGSDKTLRKQLPAKWTKNQRWLRKPEGRECRSLERFDDIHGLQDGLYLKGRKVYFKYDNYRDLSRLLRGNKDGIAVELVQPEQYSCSTPNIYDNERVSKGILLKPIYSKKLQKRNEIEGGRRAPSYEGYITKIPNRFYKKLNEGYELNLIVVQDKKICLSYPPADVEDGGVESFTPLNIHPDTGIYEGGRKAYLPKPETNDLTFKIPFEKAKYDYNQDDIQKFLDALNEPEFIINEIHIVANSSIEGDSSQNVELQKKRAESIIAAIEETQEKGVVKEIVKSINTSDSWDLFRKQIAGKKEFRHMTNMPKEEVLKEIEKPEMAEKVEPLLAEERFGQITMKVTYNIEGENEEPFVLSKIRKAIDNKDAQTALQIQKYAIKKAMKGEYDYNNLLKQRVPEEEPYANLLVNQIYLDRYFNHNATFDQDVYMEFHKLHDMAPSNAFVDFNDKMMFVKMDSITHDSVVNHIQNQIDALYNSELPDDILDALNLEFQFKVIELLDTGNTVHPKVKASLERIQKIFNIEEATWQNALKMAYIFIKHEDYPFALKTLSSFMEEEMVNDEEFIYTYLSLAAHYPEETFTKTFRNALTTARQLNKERYCNLIGTGNLSFQLLDHPLIKSEYCNTCGDVAEIVRKGLEEKHEPEKPKAEAEEIEKDIEKKN